MLYHKDVFMPEHFSNRLPSGSVRIVYSQHAIGQAFAKYGIDAEDLPAFINPKEATLVEVETDEQGEPFKFVLRVPFTNSHDICIPVIIRGKMLFAKTIWLNSRNDKHHTLKTYLYAKSP